MADKPSISWDESNPSGTQARSLGDNRIREFKTQVREVLEEDHVMDSSGQDTDWGYHKKVTLPELAEAPAYIANAGLLYTKETSGKTELFFEDGDGNEIQLTSGGALNAALLNGDQTITGIKTYSTGIVAPEALTIPTDEPTSLANGMIWLA